MNTMIQIQEYDGDYIIILEELENPCGLVRIEIRDSNGMLSSRSCNFSVAQLRHALRKIAL